MHTQHVANESDSHLLEARKSKATTKDKSTRKTKATTKDRSGLAGAGKGRDTMGTGGNKGGKKSGPESKKAKGSELQFALATVNGNVQGYP